MFQGAFIGIQLYYRKQPSDYPTAVDIGNVDPNNLKKVCDVQQGDQVIGGTCLAAELHSLFGALPALAASCRIAAKRSSLKTRRGHLTAL